MSPEPSFTHLDSQGNARMVDVASKDPSLRRAVARGRVAMRTETATQISSGTAVKGDVLAVARVAGIQAAKRTSELIPLCHPLMISSVSVDFAVGDAWVDIEAQVEVVGRTGVEMEALTACSVAALTIYDMCKSVDRDMTIGDIALWEKTGGKSGTYLRSADPPRSDLRSADLPRSDLRSTDLPKAGKPKAGKPRAGKTAPNDLSSRAAHSHE